MERTAGEQGLVSPAWFETTLHHVALAAEAVGVAVIVLGAIIAIATCLIHVRRGEDQRTMYEAFRSTLARGILLGLEFLVAADIVGTVAIEPTLENLRARLDRPHPDLPQLLPRGRDRRPLALAEGRALTA